MCDIERAAYRDTGIAQGERVPPAFGMNAAVAIRMREFVEHQQRRPACERRFVVELFERRSRGVEDARRDPREARREKIEIEPSLRIDPPQRDIDTGVVGADRVVEQAARLPSARRAREVDGQSGRGSDFLERRL
ncbi:MAG: hypothetical protein NVSMB21_12800 [Vulcanimicrobiaceae bacterium]